MDGLHFLQENYTPQRDPLQRLSQHELTNYLVAKSELLEHGYCKTGEQYYFVFRNQRTGRDGLVCLGHQILLQLQKYYERHGYEKEQAFIQGVVNGGMRPKLVSAKHLVKLGGG